MLPYGVPFDSLSFLYLTLGHFFDFKNLLGLSIFLVYKIFYRDGRMVDGGGGWWWMVDGGGWSKKKFSDFSQNFVR